MTQRTKLLKKAVLAGVGATTSVDRIKAALDEVMQDLVKVGHDLLGELETRGKSKTDTVQDFIKHFQHEASKRTNAMEKQVSQKVHGQVKKTAKEFGLATKDEVAEILRRLKDVEAVVGVSSNDHSDRPKRRRRKP